MKSLLAIALFASVASVALPHDAKAIGCLSGAAVGGVAGHYAGHHGILGAAAGCAVGHHAAVVKNRNATAAAAQQNGQVGPNGGVAPSNGYTQQ